MSLADEPLIFSDDSSELEERSSWKILIVDDELEVHTVTKLVLSNYLVLDRSIEFRHAYTALEAQKIFTEESDIAVVLLDVVMESDDAGLQLVEYIRNTANNKKVRIILRTGQPGQAPEERVIREYDINDYKEKTELTAIKLKTLVHSAVRAYRDIITLEQTRCSLEHVIHSSTKIFAARNLNQFSKHALNQCVDLLDMGRHDLNEKLGDGFVAGHSEDGYFVELATGDFAAFQDNFSIELPIEVQNKLQKTLDAESNQYFDDAFVAYFDDEVRKVPHLMYVSVHHPLTVLERNIIELFGRNASIAFQNLVLKRDIEETQKEIVCLLGETVETRSKETGGHVRRVADISKLLAIESGFSEEDAELVKFASPLHDVGKIGIPDSILHKPGKLDPDEWEVMKTHVDIGYEILRSSDKPVLQYGAIIAYEHHERWDGKGYPRGLFGEQIHILGRITAVADVFDALSSKRCYKEPWAIGDIIRYFEEQKGLHFDPTLVDILFDKLDEVIAIRERHPDEDDE